MRLGRAGGLAAFGAVALIGLLATREAAQLLGEVAVGGSTFLASSVLRVPEAWSAGTALQAWARASCAGVPVGTMLGWLLAGDAVFTAGYAGLGLGAAARWPRLAIGRLTALLALVGLAQVLLAGAAVSGMPGGPRCAAAAYRPSVLAAAIAVLATVKAVLALALAARLAWVAVAHDRPGPPGESSHPMARRLARAAGMQAFILIIVVLLAALLLLSGQSILEQGVDAERSWVLTPGRAAGAAQAAWAVAAMIALCGGLRYLASVRVAPFRVRPAAAPEAGRPAPDSSRPAAAGPGQPRLTPGQWAAEFWGALRDSWAWLLATAAVAAVLFGLGATPAARVYWQAALVVTGVLLAVPVLGAALATVPPLPAADVSDPAVRALAWQAGRALALAVPAILLISLTRALVQPLIVLPASAVTWAVFAASAVAAVAWAALVAGRGDPARLRQAADPGRGRLRDLVDPQLVGARPASSPAAPGTAAPSVPGRVASVLPSVLAVAACAVPLLVFPVHVSRLLGVIGTLGLALLLLTAFYAVLQILAQLADPPRLFTMLGAVRTPVVSIVAVIAILSPVLARGTSLHDIRPPAAPAAGDRPSLAAALAAWQARQQPGCAVTAGGTRVLPLVLVAAEGGGIRAAWWTVDAMTALTSTGCGRRSVFLASGVSGGAVGLAVLAATARPRPQLAALAGPDALAAAMDGLLSRDLVAGSVGVNVRAADGPAGDPFPDRAALLEQSWERAVPGLARPFPVPAGRRLVPWYTVFNGTSVTGKCRVLVSDIRLTGSARCDDPADPMPGAYDLLSAEPCDTGLALATAALLAARFPYVTPSGIITSCGPRPAFRDQVIDGGYSEDTGIQTLNDALAQLMPQIRADNVRAAATGAPLIAPLVIFLHNSVDATNAGPPSPPAAQPEVVVPPENEGDGGILGANATLLQEASAVAAGWVPDTVPAARARAMRRAVGQALGLQAVTVAPQQQPAIGVPLGWTLSPGSRQSLDSALSAYLSCRPAAGRTCAQSQALDALLGRWGTVMRFPG